VIRGRRGGIDEDKTEKEKKKSITNGRTVGGA
jgi:hypothetical protein